MEAKGVAHTKILPQLGSEMIADVAELEASEAQTDHTSAKTVGRSYGEGGNECAPSERGRNFLHQLCAAKRGEDDGDLILLDVPEPSQQGDPAIAEQIESIKSGEDVTYYDTRSFVEALARHVPRRVYFTREKDGGRDASFLDAEGGLHRFSFGSHRDREAKKLTQVAVEKIAAKIVELGAEQIGGKLRRGWVAKLELEFNDDQELARGEDDKEAIERWSKEVAMLDPADTELRHTITKRKHFALEAVHGETIDRVFIRDKADLRRVLDAFKTFAQHDAAWLFAAMDDIHQHRDQPRRLEELVGVSVFRAPRLEARFYEDPALFFAELERAHPSTIFAQGAFPLAASFFDASGGVHVLHVSSSDGEFESVRRDLDALGLRVVPARASVLESRGEALIYFPCGHFPTEAAADIRAWIEEVKSLGAGVVIHRGKGDRMFTEHLDAQIGDRHYAIALNSYEANLAVERALSSELSHLPVRDHSAQFKFHEYFNGSAPL